MEKRVLDTMRVKPDLDIILPDRSLLVDVVITHPSASSRHGLEPLAAARVQSYGRVAEERGSACFGFALETFGALGRRLSKS